jgi:hypothetical protein
MDDNHLLYDSSAGVANTLDTLKALGVDRIKVSVFWVGIAPAGDQTKKPDFDASDPTAYDPAAWLPFDRVVRMARERGLSVYFSVTSPAPFWATQVPPEKKIQRDYYPSPEEYGKFVHALGERYSGTYAPPHPASPDDTGPLPRVDYWSFWNEPNQAGWLTPQWIPNPHNPHTLIESSPRIYRSLVDAGWQSLEATGHGHDTILVGETAPKGLNVQGLTRSIKPLHFIRLMYCLDDRYQPLTSQVASDQGCPTTAAASRQFPSEHPGLFNMTGWAHHPYEFTFSPTTVPTDPNYATIANLPTLSATLNTILSVYGKSRPGGPPLYLTEFGYLTKPPSPLGVSLSQQSAYLDQSEFITYNNPNVRTLTQFLLVDDKPKPGVRNPVEAYGGTFQTGLEFISGKHKPAFTAYRVPVFLPATKAHRNQAVRVWGLIRPAPRGSAQQVAIQFRAGHSRAYRTLATARTQTARAYLDARVRLRSGGTLRLAWTDPATHKPIYSRTVRVKVH